MTERIELAGLKVAQELSDFVSNEVLPGTGVSERAFWEGFSAIVHDLPAVLSVEAQTLP